MLDDTQNPTSTMQYLLFYVLSMCFHLPASLPSEAPAQDTKCPRSGVSTDELANLFVKIHRELTKENEDNLQLVIQEITAQNIEEYSSFKGKIGVELASLKNELQAMNKEATTRDEHVAALKTELAELKAHTVEEQKVQNEHIEILKNKTAQQQETTKTITPLFASEISQLKVKNSELKKELEKARFELKSSKKKIEKVSGKLKGYDERFTSMKVEANNEMIGLKNDVFATKHVLTVVTERLRALEGNHLSGYSVKRANTDISTIKWKLADEIVKGQLVNTLPILGRLISIQFQLFVHSFGKDNNWYGVLHLTNGSRAGDGIISVRTKDGEVDISSFASDMASLSINVKNITETRWALIKIEQIEQGEAYLYQVHVNDKVVYSKENKQADLYQQVLVYQSSPWHEPLDGKLFNLQIDTEEGVPRGQLKCVTLRGACIFPFKFKNRVYTSCTTDGFRPPGWCAIAVNDDLQFTKWGACTGKCAAT